MKKIAVLLSLMLILTQLPDKAFAHDPVVKLSRGIVNVLTSPLEYIGQTAIVGENNNGMVAFFGGFIRGTFFTVVRAVGGVYEIATFPIPIPRDYAPVFDPETGLEIIADLNGRRSYISTPVYDESSQVSVSSSN
jgi:putative exosortase-associated protein (TIGR04073 family)